MTAFLYAALGRIPIGWLQLIRNRSRMAAALAGVTFASILVFVQLGVMGTLEKTIRVSYAPFRADLVISSRNALMLTDTTTLARRYLYQALSVPGVRDATPIYIGLREWLRPDESAAGIQIYGFPPEKALFASPFLASYLDVLKIRETVLFDQRTRSLPPNALGKASPRNPLTLNLGGTRLKAVGFLSMGGSFLADGYAIVSDQTFLHLFNKRLSGAPSRIFVMAREGEDLTALAERIRARLGSSAPVMVRTLSETIAADSTYQLTQRPVGVIFGFGVFLGILVGVVIVYQVLVTGVSDHLKEYATFRAMGYSTSFLLGIIFEEALVISVLGFFPGFFAALLIYAALSNLTSLPVEMDATRALFVFFGTIGSCLLSGVFATRRLVSADPAELF